MDYADLSLKEAAQVAEVSVATLRRKRAQLQALGAVCEPSGWHVSVKHLSAIGLLDRVKPEVSEPVSSNLVGTPQSDLVESLYRRVFEAEKRAEVAEAVAAERLVTIEAQRQALRLLEAAPAPVSEQDAPVPEVSLGMVAEPEVEVPVAPRRRGWRFWRA